MCYEDCEGIRNDPETPRKIDFKRRSHEEKTAREEERRKKREEEGTHTSLYTFKL